MKVLFILHFPPPVHGAAVVGQYIKSSLLINHEIDATYINLSTSTSVNDIGKFGIRKWGRYLTILTRVAYQGVFHRPELVYITLTSHGLGLVKDAGIVMISRLLGLSHVYHFHNKGVKKFSQTSVGKCLYPFVFKKAHVILLSPLLYSDIQKYVPKHSVHYCTNGIPDMGFREMQNSTTITQPVRLLFLSNLIKRKGILDLLEACRILKESGLNFHLTIAGGEGDISIPELDNKILEFGLEAIIFYKGKVQGEEKMLILQEADIFVHPTHEDCFPLVLLEAIQFGLPIISTEEGAIPEIVEDGQTGFLVSKKDISALSEKLEFLITNKDLRTSMGLAGRKKYEAEFMLAHFEKRFTNILQQIV